MDAKLNILTVNNSKYLIKNRNIFMTSSKFDQV